MIKEKSISLAGTIGFHIILLLCLLFYYMKPVSDNRYSQEAGGVPVMFGNVADAGGDDEPSGRGNGLTKDVTNPIESDPTIPNNLGKSTPVNKVEPTPVKTTTPKVTTNTKAPTVTQDAEKTIAINEAKKAAADKKRKDNAAAATVRKAQADADRAAQAEADRKKNINSQMAGLFGNGSGSGGRGNTQGTGTQGSPSGNGSTGKVSGVGGTGTYDLGGRGVGAGGLKLPEYHVDDYGTVVVDIIVDPKGNVIEAGIGKGTNTTNASLRNESLQAARRTKFATSSNLNNQKGTITYKFNLN